MTDKIMPAAGTQLATESLSGALKIQQAVFVQKSFAGAAKLQSSNPVATTGKQTQNTTAATTTSNSSTASANTSQNQGGK